MGTIKHEEIGGGHSGKKKIIIDACELSTGEFEAMVLDEYGNELAGYTAHNEDSIIDVFYSLVNQYAEPLQKAIYSAGLVSGRKYTFAYCNEFGFPVAQKITFERLKLCTYAQFSDCVELIFTPYHKRSKYRKILHDSSVLVFEGWQDLPENFGYTVEQETKDCTVRKSNYTCFDSHYIDDMEKVLKNPIVIYKNYKTGENGKIYA